MEEKENVENKKRSKLAYMAVFLFIILIGASFFYSLKKKTTFSLNDARGKIEALIKDSGGNATVKEVTEDGDLYKVVISFNGKDQPPVYVTKDGKKFIQQAVDFSDIEKQQAEQKKKQEEANRPVEKRDIPEVSLYVMSFCPFGNKAEDTLKPVYELLRDKANFNFHYIVNVDENNTVQSLHGPKEVAENEREACVLKNYGKDKWMNFVAYVNSNCGSDGACWEAGAKNLGISTANISSCVQTEGVALMKTEQQVSDAANASGSPTLTVNGLTRQVVYQYGNSEAYKNEICQSFTNVPAECSKTLSAGADGGAGANAANGGSCGS